MAHDERRPGLWREGSSPEWRGDEGFGGGWGNQVPRPHRTFGRIDRETGIDPDFAPNGDWYRPESAYGEPYRGSEGARYARPDFDRHEHALSSRGTSMGAGAMMGSAARAYRGEVYHDPHYSEWRDRQIAEFDRDYDDYRRETQSRFDREFGDWRQRRGEQRAALGRARAHMEVVGSDGGHVGTVDCTRGDRVVLTKSDESAGGVHHSLPCALIDRVDDKVVLNLDADEARRRWQTEDRSRALFEREYSGRRGPHILNRSFAGTYSDEE